MTARHILEVLGKSEVEGRSAQRADDRHGLRGELLRHDDTKARCDLRQETDEKRRPLADRALVDAEIGDLDQAAGEHRADREIIRLRLLPVRWRAAQHEDYSATQP